MQRHARNRCEDHGCTAARGEEPRETKSKFDGGKQDSRQGSVHIWNRPSLAFEWPRIELPHSDFEHPRAFFIPGVPLSPRRRRKWQCRSEGDGDSATERHAAPRHGAAITSAGSHLKRIRKPPIAFRHEQSPPAEKAGRRRTAVLRSGNYLNWINGSGGAWA